MINVYTQDKCRNQCHKMHRNYNKNSLGLEQRKNHIKLRFHFQGQGCRERRAGGVQCPPLPNFVWSVTLSQPLNQGGMLHLHPS